jgi:hypothetical protein
MKNAVLASEPVVERGWLLGGTLLNISGASSLPVSLPYTWGLQPEAWRSRVGGSGCVSSGT